MDKPLYIVWNDDFLQQIPIIDEQHRGVLATINSLNYFLQQGFELESLQPTIEVLIDYLVFHYKTEEGILRSTEYPQMDEYVKRTYKTIEDFKQLCETAIIKNDPKLVLQFLGDWWKRHMGYHQQITPFLSNWSGDYCRLDHPGRDWY